MRTRIAVLMALAIVALPPALAAAASDVPVDGCPNPPDNCTAKTVRIGVRFIFGVGPNETFAFADVEGLAHVHVENGTLGGDGRLHVHVGDAGTFEFTVHAAKTGNSTIPVRLMVDPRQDNLTWTGATEANATVDATHSAAASFPFHVDSDSPPYGRIGIAFSVIVRDGNQTASWLFHDDAIGMWADPAAGAAAQGATATDADTRKATAGAASTSAPMPQAALLALLVVAAATLRRKA